MAIQSMINLVFGVKKPRRVRLAMHDRTNPAEILEQRQMLSGLSIAEIMQIRNAGQSTASQSNTSTANPTSVVQPVVRTTAVAGNDNTFSGAQNLGNLTPGSGNVRRFDSVGYSGDPQDYFRFTVTGPAQNVRIALTSMSQDLDMTVMNGSGSVLASSRNGGTRSEILTGSLATGTYYVRVYPGVTGARSNYGLEISSTVSSVVGRQDFTVASNGTIRTTRTIGTSSTGTEHWYRITVTSRRTVDIQLGRMSRDLDLEIRSGSSTRSTILASSRNGGNRADRVTTTLNAGTYWVRVVPYQAGRTSYTLNINLSGRFSWSPLFA